MVLLSLLIITVMVTGETLPVKNTGADARGPRDSVSWYRRGDQLHTHRLCSAFPTLVAQMRCLKRATLK